VFCLHDQYPVITIIMYASLPLNLMYGQCPRPCLSWSEYSACIVQLAKDYSTCSTWLVIADGNFFAIRTGYLGMVCGELVEDLLNTIKKWWHPWGVAFLEASHVDQVFEECLCHCLPIKEVIRRAKHIDVVVEDTEVVKVRIHVSWISPWFVGFGWVENWLVQVGSRRGN